MRAANETVTSPKAPPRWRPVSKGRGDVRARGTRRVPKLVGLDASGPCANPVLTRGHLGGHVGSVGLSLLA